MMDNRDNQWQAFLETGKQADKAVNSKEIVDVQKELKAKYPGIPIPNADRIVRKISIKQQGAVIFQRGGK